MTKEAIRKHNDAVDAVRIFLNAKDAANYLGITPGALRERLRRGGSTVQGIAEIALRDRARATKAGKALVEAEKKLRSKRDDGRPFTISDAPGPFERLAATAGKRRVAGPAPSKLGPFPRDVEDGVKVYLVATDVHVPYHCPIALGAFCDLVRDLQPDGLVLGGDFLDLIEVSRHASSSVAQLEGLRISKSFEEGRKVLDRIVQAGGAGMTERYFLDGNHEDRLARWVKAGDNAVWLGDEGTSIAHRLGLKDRGFTYVEGYPEAKVYLGKLAITHGIWTNKFHANAHLDRFKHSVMYGHTHVPQMHYGSSLKNKVAAYGLGHMADPKSPAMSYAPTPNAWCQGFGVVYVRKSGEFNVQQIQLWDGTFFYGNRQYGRRK